MELSSTFGMTEMEVAAEFIVAKCAQEGTWLVPLTYEDFSDWLAKAGFLQLLERQFLQSFYRKTHFFVTQKFINQIREFKFEFYQTKIVSVLPSSAPTWDEYNNMIIKSYKVNDGKASSN